MSRQRPTGGGTAGVRGRPPGAGLDAGAPGLALAVLRADEVDDVLRVVARWGAERLGFGTAVAYVREPGARGLVARTGHPAAAIEGAAEELSLRGLGADATRVLIEERVPLVIPDVAGDERTAGTGLRTRGVRSVLAVPLLHGGEVVGVLLFALPRCSPPTSWSSPSASASSRCSSACVRASRRFWRFSAASCSAS
ncbi:GAF domain-containing protein, partial [Patulibacter sp. NPDC049589]|uniref:GAF domain-containing protein n=1 Tax=Patulibacter sp. NPDC049589 TaxID=3154731 RepID=UPI00343F6087